MKIQIAFFAVFACLFGAGCRKEEQTDNEKWLDIARQDFRRYGELLTRGGGNPNAFAHETAAKLQAMPDGRLRSACFKEWADVVLQFDFTKTPIDDGLAQAGRSWSAVRDLFENTLRYQTRTFEERWELQLRYLEWCRLQIRELEKLPTCPKGVRRVWLVNGQGHWEVEKASRDDFAEYVAKLERYNSFAEEYESHLLNREAKFGKYCEGESGEVVARISARFEKFLGRKIRSESEWKSDFAEKRRREFPTLVPTPDGLVKCWDNGEMKIAEHR